MLQRGDNMSHFENGYVQQLIHWGDEVRNKLVEERGINQEQVIEQLENWQHRLRNILHSNQPIAYEQLMELRNEGEQFLDEWSQNRSSKQPIAYGKRKLPLNVKQKEIRINIKKVPCLWLMLEKIQEVANFSLYMNHNLI